MDTNTKPAAGAGDPAAGGQGTPPVSNATGGQGATDVAQSGNPDQPHVNHKEFVDYGKRVQHLEKTIKGLEASLAKQQGGNGKVATDEKIDPVSQLAAQVESMRTEKAIRDIADDLGVKLSPKQRARLEQLHGIDKPGDIGEWMQDQIELFGLKPTQVQAQGQSQQTQAAATQQAKPQGKQTQANLGAPGRTQETTPSTLADMDGETWKALGKDGRRDFMAKQDPNGARTFVRPMISQRRK